MNAENLPQRYLPDSPVHRTGAVRRANEWKPDTVYRHDESVDSSFEDEDEDEFDDFDPFAGGGTPPDGTTAAASERASELRNAELLNALYGHDLLWNVDRRKWMQWSGTHWAEDVGGYAEQCAKAVARGTFQRLSAAGMDEKEAKVFAKRAESMQGINAVLALLRSEPGRMVSEKGLDADPHLLNLANGTLDLRDDSLRHHDRADRLSVCLSTAFDPTAPAPRWEAFLSRVMAGDTSMIGYLQRLAGYCLSGKSDLQELYIPFGAGANGKSVRGSPGNDWPSRRRPGRGLRFGSRR